MRYTVIAVTQDYKPRVFYVNGKTSPKEAVEVVQDFDIGVNVLGVIPFHESVVVQNGDIHPCVQTGWYGGSNDPEWSLIAKGVVIDE